MSADSRVVLTAVAARVIDRLPELSARIDELIVAHEGAYQSGGAVPLTVLTRSVDANMHSILEALAGAARPEDDELACARTTGRHRAQQGVPLESVLRAYRLATQVILHAMMAEVRGRPYDELEAFLDVTTAVTEVVDRHSQAVVDGYRRTEAELRHRDAQRQQAMFDALLEGRGSDSQTAAEALDALGLPATGRYAVVVAAFDVAAQHTFSAARDALAAYGFTAAWRSRSDREIGLVSLADGPLSRLLSTLRRTPLGRVGVSDAFDGVRDVPDAHRWAELAARTIPPGEAEVASIAERLPEALLAASPALAERLARDTLGGVLDVAPEERDLLLHTLAEWFDHGRSAARAALVLYCHRNTVVNRLHRIEHLSGGSLDDHRFLLHCYLSLLTLRPPRPSAAG
ncbi:PucR family transcriptional regulator [Streptacidiphilus fuscans]|uniref:Helix-turn-helix domain-containing protein n=1 Tax=Streptacidiphilus fuscans TaxID=2789292 RepID=A0A931FEU8_9ACTN|nr:helix-turn-helix domain-containing protein [Streptacidiphilus fuscans]MBF9069620.1 helix-turn-helix domain-containing protein [Streptacidiphilus fuscans]